MFDQPAPAICLGRHSYSSEFYRNDNSENIKDSTGWSYDVMSYLAQTVR